MIRKSLIATLMSGIAFAFILTTSQDAHAATVVLEGTIKKKTLKPGNIYLLRGGVFVSKKLKIKAGTQIFGLPGSFLVIEQGAEIAADGTREKPIVFTSAAPEGTRARGDWGGLIFNGKAPINVPGGTASGEGDTGTYGGNDASDSSGRMTFVRVEYGGFAISPENELNCIAFQGVGSGTEVDFIQALFGGDDGIEMFGGSVNFKHAVATGASDDSIDWTFGWNGKVQFAVVQQRADEADAGIEADNNENDFSFTPRSDPKMANVTLVGDPGTGNGSTRGVLLRRGTAGDLRNFIVMNFKNVGIELRDEATFAQLNNDNLTIRGVIFFNNGVTLATPSNFAGATSTALNNKGVKILQADPQLRSPLSKTAPDFRPLPTSPALVAANVEPGFANDSFFVTANYVGAFDANDDWTLGWTQWVFGN